MNRKIVLGKDKIQQFVFIQVNNRYVIIEAKPPKTTEPTGSKIISALEEINIPAQIINILHLLCFRQIQIFFSYLKKKQQLMNREYQMLELRLYQQRLKPVNQYYNQHFNFIQMIFFLLKLNFHSNQKLAMNKQQLINLLVQTYTINNYINAFLVDDNHIPIVNVAENKKICIPPPPSKLNLKRNQESQQMRYKVYAHALIYQQNHQQSAIYTKYRIGFELKKSLIFNMQYQSLENNCQKTLRIRNTIELLLIQQLISLILQSIVIFFQMIILMQYLNNKRSIPIKNIKAEPNVSAPQLDLESILMNAPKKMIIIISNITNWIVSINNNKLLINNNI